MRHFLFGFLALLYIPLVHAAPTITPQGEGPRVILTSKESQIIQYTIGLTPNSKAGVFRMKPITGVIQLIRERGDCRKIFRLNSPIAVCHLRDVV